MSRPSAVLLGYLLAACGHPDPFQPGHYTTTGPWSTTSPHRLTFSPGDDRTPSWLPDGSGIIYSTSREDRRDHDRCLAILPPDGGAIVRTLCDLGPAMEDSTNLWESPSVASDGRMVFFQVTSWIGQQKLGNAALMLGRIDDPQDASLLRRVGYTAPNGRAHGSVRLIQWIGPAELVYLGELLTYEGSSFYPDTIISGLDVMRLDLSSGTPQFSVVPRTDYASGLSYSGEPDVVYYTLGGDSKVYRQVLSTGDTNVVYDFGAGNIARDVSVRSHWLVAVVGRSVLWQYESANGWVQRDEGGDLHVVDLNTAAEQVFATDSVLFRHPLMAPAGNRFVVEASPYAPVHPGPVSGFNAPNHRDDLWLFDLP